MMNYKRVEGQSKLMKDPTTGVIINSDDDEIENARLRKITRKQKERDEQELRDKVDGLTESVSRLETMFRQLLER